MSSSCSLLRRQKFGIVSIVVSWSLLLVGSFTVVVEVEQVVPSQLFVLCVWLELPYKRCFACVSSSVVVVVVLCLSWKLWISGDNEERRIVCELGTELGATGLLSHYTGVFSLLPLVLFHWFFLSPHDQLEDEKKTRYEGDERQGDGGGDIAALFPPPPSLSLLLTSPEPVSLPFSAGVRVQQ